MTGDLLSLSYEYRSTEDHVAPEASIEHQRGVERIADQLGFVITPPGPLTETQFYLAVLGFIFLLGTGIEVFRRVVFGPAPAEPGSP